MKKVSVLLAIVMVLGLIVSCKPKREACPAFSKAPAHSVNHS